MPGFERPGLELGMYQADADLSDEKHQFTAVWLGVGKNATSIPGNAAILKKAAAAAPDAGQPPAPAQTQLVHTFKVTDTAFASTSTYSILLGGTNLDHTKGQGETAEQVLTDLGQKAKTAEAKVLFAVSKQGADNILKLRANDGSALDIAEGDTVGLTVSSAQEPVPADDDDAGDDEDAGVGELKGGPLGILQNRPQQGEACNVLISGISMVVAGGEWAPGDSLGVDDDGAVVKVTDGAVLGVAAKSAVKGAISSILLLPRTTA